MTRAYLVQIDAWDGATAAPIRLASHDDERLCHLDGQTWWPAIQTLPKLRADYFGGSFDPGSITSPTGTLTAYVDAFPDLRRLTAHDARFRLWEGEIGDAFAAYQLIYDGRVKEQPPIAEGIASIGFGADDGWLDQPLLQTYAGTGGAEGGTDLEGRAKPLAIGAPRFAPGTLIDAAYSIFQISAYGAIVGVEEAFERLVRFGPPVADYPTFAALRAATIVKGTWATCLAQGLARFGAPPDGMVCFHVAGDNVGGWSRLPGAVIARLAAMTGGAGRVSAADVAALNASRPWPISLMVTEQTTGRELIQRIAASVNAVAFVDWLGVLRIRPIGVGTPALTLAADGSSLPPVTKVQRVATGAPYWRIAQGAARTWQVHAYGDIAFTAPLDPRGVYDPAETYRVGQLVTLDDGSLWLFVSDTPASGSFPAEDNPDWQLMSGALTATRIFFLDHFPADARIGDICYRIDQGNRKYRYTGVDAALSWGGSTVDIGGVQIAAGEWVEVTDDRLMEQETVVDTVVRQAETMARSIGIAEAEIIAAQELAQSIHDSVTVDINDLRDQILAAGGDFAEIESTLGEHGATISTLQTTVSNQDGTLATYNTRISSAESAITANGTAISTANSNVANLTVTVGAVDAAVTSQATAISTLQGQQASLGSTVSTQGAAITSLETVTSTVQGDVATLTSTVSAQGATITSQATAITALNGDISTIFGQWVLGIDVNGRIADIRLANNGATSSLRFRSDVVSIESPTGTGPRTEYSNGVWRIYAGAVMTAWGPGFGSTGQFVRWFGPAQASLSGCTEANAIEYLKTDGTAYFGGALLAGALRASDTNPSLSTTASATTGTIGSNGGPISVIGSWTYTSTQTQSYAATSGGVTSYEGALAAFGATVSGDGIADAHTASKAHVLSGSDITLYVRKSGAILDSQAGAAGTVSLVGWKPIPGDSPGSITWTYSYSLSLTVPDPEQSATNRLFSADIVRGYTSPGTGHQQRVGVQSVEY